MELDELTPARVLLLRYMLLDRLTAPGSISGHQADRLRSGLGGRPPDGGRPNTAETMRARLADLLLLCRDLNRTEELCCRMRYGATAVAGSVTYTLLRRLCDLREGDGEEIVDLRPQGPDGSPMPGWVTVRGVKARYPSYGEIAQRLALDGVCNSDGQPMTPGAVERRLRDASAKISWAIRARRAMADWEDRAA